MAYLPDDVTGFEELNLDGCILACRRKSVSYMALKTTACYCSEFMPVDYLEGTADHCRPIDCPASFKCGKGSSLAIYKVCKDGHFGESCEMKCFCESYTCRVRDGFCLASDGRCQRGYLGKACNVTDPCSTKQVFCQNGGKCQVSKVGLQSVKWFCDCAPGYFGDNCTEKCPQNRYGHECVFNCYCENDKPCFVNNGSCPSGCEAGYFGKDCSMVDRCLWSPCKNGGKCFRDEDGFFCDCTHLYTGDTCTELMKPKYVTVGEVVEDKRKKILEKEKEQMKLQVAKESLAMTTESALLGVSFDEDRTLFGTLAEYVVDKIQEHFFMKPSPGSYVENINMGCFRDLSPSLKGQGDMKGFMKVMRRPLSIETCRNFCRKKKFTFAGAMRGEICLCGNSYGKYGAVSHTACSEPCGDDREKKCGGRRAYSVYPVCAFGRYGPNCEFGCFCASLPCMVDSGHCPDGACLYGWIGQQCNVKHVSWTAPDRLATFILVYLVVYVIVVVTSIVFIYLIKFRNERDDQQPI